MFRALWTYLWGCICHAWRGSISSALNWASIIGIGAVGAYLEKMGSPMSDPHTWYGIVGWTVVYTAVTWAIIFAFRLVVAAPFHLWREQKDRADGLEGLRNLAAEVSRTPSFDLGFEKIEHQKRDEEDPSSFESIYNSLARKNVCVIWIENIDQCAIENCRVVLEDFQPRTPEIIPGAMLLSVNKDGDQTSPLASSERRYFRFLDYMHGFKIVTQLHGGESEGGFTALAQELRTPGLPTGQRFFATIVVHGKNAGSRRLNLVIDTISGKDIQISWAASTPPTKEKAHEHQGS